MKKTAISILGFGICVLSACGVNGDKIFGANAQDDNVFVDDFAAPFVIDPIGNDGGSGRIIEDVTQGFYGECTIGSGELDIEYTPFPVTDGKYFADWFEYRIRANNNSYDVGRVAVRFVEVESDRFEPDDFQEYARPINLRFGIPTVENHTSDYTNVIPLNGTFVHGQTIGGDEDWFQVEVQAAPTAGLVTYLRIETILPGVADSANHNALVVTVMDQWGFLMGSAAAGSGPGSNDAETGADATTFDAVMAPATYLIRISPENGHRGPYDVRFTMYEAAPPVVAPPIGVGKVTK